MNADVENLTEKTDNLSIGDSNYSTNWNNLSGKLKLQCIEKMELKERLLLRCTSKSEKTLVDSNKIQASFAEFFIFPEQSTVSIKLKNKPTEHLALPRGKNYKFIVPLIESLLQLVSFDQLVIRSSEKIDFTDELSGGQLHVKCFWHESCSNKDLMYWLNALKSSEVETIKFDADLNENFPFDKLLKVPNIWIDKDAEIKKTFLVQVLKDGTMDDFKKTFSDRIVCNSENLIRIRTDNPAKQIALELGIDEGEDYDDIDALQYIRMMVIPSELQEEEYDWNTNKWMNLLDPERDISYWDSDSDVYDSDGPGEWEFDYDDD
ncbi:hypothetical protein CAEBREN_02038 [Caenorhabditis brenneri]|uniref:F-box domain-containing protein n=1 Tax=Caenorhabditis brenneri TaxID=135651 RepID=G0N760_CAEBE|nr:hypothetical protein CAEBREN_02038 [Caenorhabditis brenneri]